MRTRSEKSTGLGLIALSNGTGPFPCEPRVVESEAETIESERPRGKIDRPVRDQIGFQRQPEGFEA